MRNEIEDTVPIMGMISDAYDQLRTTNLALNKLAEVLAYDVRSILLYTYQVTEQVFPMLLTFGESTVHMSPGAVELQFAAALPKLCTAAKAVHELTLLLVNLLQQLGALCSEQTRKSTVISGPHTEMCVSRIACGLAVLLRLDTIISKSTTITAASTAYMRMLSLIVSNEDQFGVERAQQAQLQQGWVAELQAGLLSGSLFRGFLQQHCSRASETSQICGHGTFPQAVSAIIRMQVQAIVDRIQSKSEVCGDRQALLGLLCLGAVHSHICTPHVGLDKKLIKQLLDLHHKVPLLPAFCHLSVNPASFLSKMLPPAADRYIRATYVSEALAEQRVQAGNSMDSFAAQLQQGSLTVLAWQADLAALHAAPRSNEALLTKLAGAAVRGVDLGAALRDRLQVLLDLHAAAGLPISQQALTLFVKALCLVKGVNKTFEQHSKAMAGLLPQLIAHTRSAIQGLLTAMAAKVRAKQRQLASTAPSLLQFTSTRTATEKALKDAETAVEAALQAIAGSASRSQLVMLELCRDAISATASISEHRLEALDTAMRTLETLLHLPEAVAQATDCSWLYFDRALLGSIVRGIMKQPERAPQLPYVLAAFMDAHSLFSQATTAADAYQLKKGYSEQVHSMLEKGLLLPLCQHVETDLRLHHHAAALVGVTPLNPLTDPLLDTTPLLGVGLLHLGAHSTSIRHYVEQRLGASFRSHTAVTPHDWQTYEEMRSLGLDKYGLRTAPIDLPVQASDQRAGDVLAALDNLPDFVARHSYSQATCTFLQRPSAAAHTGHLERITAQEAAFAAQRRSPGPLWDEAVQSVSSLLQDHLQQLHKMVTQEDVIAVLTAARALCQNQGTLDSPSGEDPQESDSQVALSSEFLRVLSSEELVQHAYAVKEGLQQLEPDGSTRDILGGVQRTITEMGNALGFLCILQHGIAEYSEAARDHHQPPSVNVHSGHMVNLGIDAQQANGDQVGSIMLQVSGALCLTAAEAAAEAKEQLLTHRRKLPEQAQAFDDGYAIGLAYIVQVLQVDSCFRELRWWSAAKAHFQGRQQQLQHCQTPSTSSTGSASTAIPSWLNIFTAGKPSGSSGANAQSNSAASQMLSDVDIGRRHMQSQQLVRVQNELQLMQATFEGAAVAPKVDTIWSP